MVVQARAAATRRRIIEAAVTLFAENGYGETGLVDVLQHAGVSKGAFYYHFDSKEAVASAIIGEFHQRLVEAVDWHVDSDAPTLEGIIRATFAVQCLMRSDLTIKIGQELSQALSQVSVAGARMYGEWTERFAEMVRAVIAAGELRSDVDPADASESIWAAVLGSHLVSAALHDDPYVRLARSWRVLLRSLLPKEAWAGFDSLLNRIVADYAEAPCISVKGLAASSS
ncbi:MAG: TetR/AcrR family transcriptional regulator [Mycobacterium sp.]|nr:TetR/AcrR family transcriptional regulator [Mycobacterium sp.]